MPGPSLKRPAAAKAGGRSKKRPAASDNAGDDAHDEAFEAASAKLSATGSAKIKLQILRGLGSDMDVKTKIDLMNKCLSHNDWKAFHGMKHTAEEHDEDLKPEGSTNLQKRNSVMGWALDPSKGEVYQSLKHNLVGSQTLTKTNEWMSKKRMLDLWTEEEFEMHLGSGRIIPRECIDTPGVWVYQDTNNVVHRKQISRQKNYEKKSGQQMLGAETKEDDDESWGKLWMKMGSQGTLDDVDLFGGPSSSSSSGYQKGRGKGGKLAIKGGHGGNQSKEALAIEDDPAKKLAGSKIQLKTVLNKAMSMCYDNVKLRNKLKPSIAKLKKLQEMTDDMGEESTDKVKAFCKDVQVAVKEAKALLD